jgi:hypothetical protein
MFLQVESDKLQGGEGAVVTICEPPFYALGTAIQAQKVARNG